MELELVSGPPRGRRAVRRFAPDIASAPLSIGYLVVQLLLFRLVACMIAFEEGA